MSWQWRMIQKLKRNWLVVLKLTWRSSQTLTQALKSLKNLCFNWLFVTKVFIVWATKVQRSDLLWCWRDMQILKKNWLVVCKKTWEIWQIFTTNWARREYIWKLNWKESFFIYFENLQGALCFHRQSRNRMMNTFIIVNISPICR